MCGIFGVIRKYSTYVSPNANNSNEKMISLFTSLAISSTERGKDSSGLAIFPNQLSDNNDKVIVLKDSVPADILITTDKFKKAINTINNCTCAIIGHARNASSSSPRDNKNNHPHICENIIGIHNGTISNWKELSKKHNLKMKSICDSEVIFLLINEFLNLQCTFIEAIQETSKLLEGSFACVAVNLKGKREFAFFRRSAPLFIKHRAFGNIILLASNIEYINKAYRDAQYETTHSKNYYEMNEYILPDNNGIILNPKDENFTNWLQYIDSFTLS